jgi:PAS domain S-box-containing protein
MTDATSSEGSSRENLGEHSQPYARGAAGLAAAVQQLSLAHDLPTVQQIVRNAARALTGADGATFVLREGDMCFYADEDGIAPLWKGQPFPLEAHISLWSMVHRRSVAIEDISADDRVPHDAHHATSVKSLVTVPIRPPDPLGAIGVSWAQRHVPTTEDVELLEALADSAAVAAEHMSLPAGHHQREPLARRIIAADVPAWAELFNLLPVAVIATDTAGIITHWNPHAERLFGWLRAETLGHSVHEFTVGPETTELAEEIMAQVTAGRAWHGEFAVQRKNGTQLLIRVVDAPIFDEGGDTVGTIGVSVDVTRSRAVERREKLEALEQAMGWISSFMDDLGEGDEADRQELDVLTARQREIVAFLRRGLRVRTIAERLGISESTVRNHLDGVYDRLGVRSQRELLELLSE